jgi:hypothetical protein
MKRYYEGFTEMDHVGSWPSCPQSICNINSFAKKKPCKRKLKPCLWDTNLAKLSAFHVSTCQKKRVFQLARPYTSKIHHVTGF